MGDRPAHCAKYAPRSSLRISPFDAQDKKVPLNSGPNLLPEKATYVHNERLLKHGRF